MLQTSDRLSPVVFGVVHPVIGAEVLSSYGHLGIRRAGSALKGAQPSCGGSAYGTVAPTKPEGTVREPAGNISLLLSHDHGSRLDAYVPSISEGLTIRQYDPETETEAVSLTLTDPSRIIWCCDANVRKGLQISTQFHRRARLRPAFLFVAMDGDEWLVFPSATVDYEDPECGWVAELGVLRPWRKRGVGYALLNTPLQHSTRTKKTGRTGCRFSNLTGGLRLYERPGCVCSVSSISIKGIAPRH